VISVKRFDGIGQRVDGGVGADAGLDGGNDIEIARVSGKVLADAVSVAAGEELCPRVPNAP
jgi:hypothetical protein